MVIMASIRRMNMIILRGFELMFEYIFISIAWPY